jgi:hypothetical protein
VGVVRGRALPEGITVNIRLEGDPISQFLGFLLLKVLGDLVEDDLQSSTSHIGGVVRIHVLLHL